MSSCGALVIRTGPDADTKQDASARRISANFAEKILSILNLQEHRMRGHFHQALKDYV